MPELGSVAEHMSMYVEFSVLKLKEHVIGDVCVHKLLLISCLARDRTLSP
jgi:hypothetical protein